MSGSKITQKAFAAGSALPPLAKDTLRLYSMRFCPYAQRTRLVLAHKKIPVQIVNVNLQNKPEWFLEKNPLGKAPVLEYNDQVVYDSDICNEFLDDKYSKKKLIPKDPYVKARHRILKEHFNTWIGLFYKMVLDPSVNKEETIKGMHVELDRLEKAIGTKKYFGGSELTMLDLYIWPWFERLPAFFPDSEMVPKEKFPKLSAWVGHMWQTDAVKATAHDAQLHIDFKNSYSTGALDYDIGLEE